MNKVAIIQSNYVPWKGYFDIIRNCDCFVFLDDVQYTRRDWRNRNVILTPKGPVWLTVPVDVKGKFADLSINEVTVVNNEWANHHLNLIKENYRKANCFKTVYPWIEELYRKAAELVYLSEINQLMIISICKYLDINTNFYKSTDFFSTEELKSFEPSARLMEICKKTNASEYISGPSAKTYLDETLFHKNNLKVIWADYSGYPKYQQLHNYEFENFVSILDLLLIHGKETKNYFKSVGLLLP